MSKPNQRNFYIVQDLKTSEVLIRKMLNNNCRLITIYKFLRAEARWISIGDFPLICIIVKTANKSNKRITKISATRLLNDAKDGEFKKVRPTSELISQLCA